MKKIDKLISALAATFLFLSLYACTGGGGQTETPTPPPASPAQTETASALPDTPSNPAIQPDDTADPSVSAPVSGEVVITFDYTKISGAASNQYAVWVEDMDGNYVNTVFATQWTAAGGWQTRPDSIALWVERSSIPSMPDYYLDAISGATPKATSSQTYTWNLKDINGDTVSPGEYKVFVEGTLRWKNYVLYSGAITIGNVSATVQADAEYVYEASDEYDALTGDSPENNMIGPVTVSYVPAAGTTTVP